MLLELILWYGIRNAYNPASNFAWLDNKVKSKFGKRGRGGKWLRRYQGVVHD